MSKSELAIILNADSRFVGDLLTLKKTEKYVRQAQTEAVSPGGVRIINEKREQATGRLRDLTLKAKVLLTEARLFARGAEIEIRSEDAQSRIERAFETLVDKVHTNLGMLRGIAYSEDEIGKFLSQGGDGLPGADTGVTEAEQEILNYVRSNANIGVRSTVKAVVDRFQRSPYGWSYPAILCTTASLLGRGRMEARLDGGPLEGDALRRDLSNTHKQANIVLEQQAEFTPAQTRKLKEFYGEFFGAPPKASDAKALGIETGEAFAKVKDEINRLEAQKSSYPFLAALGPVRDAVNVAAGKSYAWYLTDLGQDAEHLLDLKEDVLDKVRSFMAGTQRGIYDDARAWLAAQNANLNDASRGKAAAVRAVLDDPNCFKGNAIHHMKGGLDALKAEVNVRIAAERAAALAEVDTLHDKVQALPDYSALAESERQAVGASFASIREAIGAENLIAVIRDRINRFKTSTYPTLLGRVTAPAHQPAEGDGGLGCNDGDDQQPYTPPVFVAVSTLRVAYEKAFLGDERDVEAYLSALRKLLMAEIQAGKRITI